VLRWRQVQHDGGGGVSGSEGERPSRRHGPAPPGHFRRHPRRPALPQARSDRPPSTQLQSRSIDSKTAHAHAHTSLQFVFCRGRAVRARAGIMFNDITALLLRPDVFKDAVDMFVERYRCMGIAAVAGTESNLC
jgi:hypothetical protein